MRYETVHLLKDEEFKRSIGVQRATFVKLPGMVETGLRDFGRPAKLRRADQLLLTLMYWCEYRTEFHIDLAYSVSESIVCRTIKKVEDVPIKSEQLHLPGGARKKATQIENCQLADENSIENKTPGCDQSLGWHSTVGIKMIIEVLNHDRVCFMQGFADFDTVIMMWIWVVFSSKGCPPDNNFADNWVKTSSW